MKFSILFLVVLHLTREFSSATSTSQKVVEVNCTFTASGSEYVCLVPRLKISDDLNQTIVFGGKHVRGCTNEDVNHIFFEPVSNIPFVIVEMFTTFPNVVDVRMMDVGLTRIQSGAFALAKNLEMIYIRNNSQLTIIEENAFTGASKLNYIELSNNSIEVIHEAAFSKLERLRYLYLNVNRIRQLPENVFKSLTALEFLYLQDNLIETLNGRVLGDNQNLTVIFFDDNKINAIGRTFLNSLKNLEVLAIRNNSCVDKLFSMFESSTIEMIHKSLKKCYENYDERNNVEVFTLELHGTLLLRDESGNEIKLSNN